MPEPRDLPAWRLPKGVAPGAWDYAHSADVVDHYDDEFAANTLFDFDESFVVRSFPRPGRVVDLGCGTGRLLVTLARRGFQAVGIDLSAAMLAAARAKLRAAGLDAALVRANLVELDALADGAFDYAACLFSTLGMIRGRAHRRRALGHVARLLRPGGRFVCHVHNRWRNLFDPQGRRWLAGHLPRARWNSPLEPGDKYFRYRDVAQMYLHVYTRGELLADLRAAGLRVRELVALDTARRFPLTAPWCLGWLRANGWIACCERPSG